MSLTTRRRNAANAPSAPVKKDIFSVETLEAVAADLESGRLPVSKTTITDPETIGLSALVRNTGLISFQVQYTVGGSRPMLTIGHHPEMTIARARRLAPIVRSLGNLGIDPQEGLHERLVRELERDGANWRPDGKPARK